MDNPNQDQRVQIKIVVGYPKEDTINELYADPQLAGMCVKKAEDDTLNLLSESEPLISCYAIDVKTNKTIAVSGAQYFWVHYRHIQKVCDHAVLHPTISPGVQIMTLLHAKAACDFALHAYRNTAPSHFIHTGIKVDKEYEKFNIRE